MSISHSANCRAARHDILRFLVRELVTYRPPVLTPSLGFRHHGGMGTRRRQRSYDHRLVQLVQEARDPTIATRLGVPRSTATGWVKRAPRVVTTAETDESVRAALEARVARLERRNEVLAAFIRVLLALLRMLKPDLAHVRVEAPDKARVLRAVHRSRRVPGLSRLLSRVGLSASRLRSWRRAERACRLEDQSSCPRFSPQGLTPAEIGRVRELVTSPDHRHVPTGRLAILAQRLALVFASATTWHRLIRERGWRRPRLRIHPASPTEGIRAAKPNDIWHIDTTLLRLLDGTRIYLHAVIDNFSRRILAWHLADRFEPASTVTVLVQAGRLLDHPDTPPMLLVDAGVENVNKYVDKLVDSGLLKRVLAQTEIRFSNSMIEAWWRSLKHNWLFLHALDSATRARSLVEFYVAEHNTKIPHAAFHGQTPDEMYFGRGDGVAERLAEERAIARRQRLELNRAQRCAACA